MVAIDVRALTKSYGDVQALRGVDLTIDSTGQIIGLLGPNGAGKTTLVEILEGLRTASSGSVAVLGLDPAHAPGALRARLGVQLQTTAFMPELTVLETLRLYAACIRSRLSARRTLQVRVLERVDLKDKAKAVVRTLVRWTEAAPRVGHGHAARSRSLHPRRADVGSRSDRAAADSRHPARAETRREDDPAVVALSRRDRGAGRPRDHPLGGTNRCRRHAAGAAGAIGRRVHAVARRERRRRSVAAAAASDLRRPRRRDVSLPHGRSHCGDRRAGRFSAGLGRDACRPASQAALARGRLSRAHRGNRS